MKHTLTVTVIFMDIMIMMYHVQFIMSVIVLQSTWFLLSTHALQDGPESTYYGYLMAGYYKHSRSQYTYMGVTLKSVVGSAVNHNGLLFYFVEGRCGSLPCPP